MRGTCRGGRTGPSGLRAGAGGWSRRSSRLCTGGGGVRSAGVGRRRHREEMWPGPRDTARASTCRPRRPTVGACRSRFSDRWRSWRAIQPGRCRARRERLLLGVLAAGARGGRPPRPVDRGARGLGLVAGHAAAPPDRPGPGLPERVEGAVRPAPRAPGYALAVSSRGTSTRCDSADLAGRGRASSRAGSRRSRAAPAWSSGCARRPVRRLARRRLRRRGAGLLSRDQGRRRGSSARRPAAAGLAAGARRVTGRPVAVARHGTRRGRRAGAGPAAAPGVATSGRAREPEPEVARRATEQPVQHADGRHGTGCSSA